jgi:4-amino-4-deoxy-L-arabinose transferase-like glycosyltransferase
VTNRIDKLIAAALFVVTLCVTLAATPSEGINRDEAYYMEAGEQYITYWERALGAKLPHPFSDAAIDHYWEYNHEHPPLMKLLYGLSWRLFHDCHCAAERDWHPGPAQLSSGKHITIPLFRRESTAFRFPTILFFASLAPLVYMFFLEAFGGRAGALAAAILAICQPRAFFHAETAGFDLPVAVFWFATMAAYWRALNAPRPIWAGVKVGLLYGLFLSTKLQSFFLPFALSIHFAWVWFRTKRMPNVFALVGMAVLGPLVFIALWPWLWHHTVARFGAYLGFHWHHVHYNFEYLGKNYNHPPYPWHEPLGMLVTTAPVVLLVLAAAGIGLLIKTRKRADGRSVRVLLLLAGIMPIAPFFLGSTPIFGETKHWLATMPILAVCAGVAVQALADGVAREARIAPRWAGAILVILAGAPAAVETARSHPYGLSHYNALAGGAPGGADLGMNRQFWGYSVAGLLPWFDKTLPPETKIYLHDWNHDAFLMDLRDHTLRRDLDDAGMEDPGVRASSAAIVIHELHFNKYEYMIWDAYKTVTPSEVLTEDGVPLVTAYVRP